MTKVAPLDPNKPPPPKSGKPDELHAVKTLSASPENAAPALHGSTPAPKQRKGKKSRKEVAESHPSGDSSEVQDGIEDSGNESTTLRHNSGTTAVRRRYPISNNRGSDQAAVQDIHSVPDERASKKNRKEITESHASGDSSEDQDRIEDSGNESTIPLHNSDATTVRRRYPISNNRVSDQAAAQDNHSIPDERASRQLQQGLFLLDVAKDIWRLTETALGLPRALYPIWKWFVVAYIIWLAISYLVVSVYRSATTTLAPICSIPFIGPQIPFCAVSIEPNGRPINASKVACVATCQEGLIVVMDRVGHNFGLARDMVGREFAVRDLRIRVAASNLLRKQELTRELELLIRYTKQTAKGLSRFAARVSKSIDTVNTFDEFAVKALESIAERQRNPPVLASRAIAAISPFAAFAPANAGHFEEQVQHLFIMTATQISYKVRLLIGDSFNLTHNLDIIQETLDRIKELAIDEIGDLPRMDVLRALWTKLAHADDYEQHKPHTSLLADMTDFYKSASSAMNQTTEALNHVEAELTEFRDEFATPALILKDYPLEVITALLRKAGQRLEAGKRKLEHIEEGGKRPQQGNDIQKASSTKTVVAVTSL